MKGDSVLTKHDVIEVVGTVLTLLAIGTVILIFLIAFSGG
jgi:hypothetical protein